MADLVVELYGVRVGTLVGDWRTFDFVGCVDGVERFGLDSMILSCAIPLAIAPTRARRSQRQGFFRELLPEGRMLTRMAELAKVPSHDTVAMLRRYGRDIAGALQIWDSDLPGEPRQPAKELVCSAEIAEMLAEVHQRPLGNALVGGKTSLAGVQDKIVLAHAEDEWFRVLDGYPSTHILKPVSPDALSAIYDEEYGARFSRALGLADFDTRIQRFGATDALVIQRYDRASSSPGGRVHQEDFSQVLGAIGHQKYQKYGGRVSLSRIARMLAAAGQPLDSLLRMVVLAVAVGNLDMHAKNISLLHPVDGSIVLAPSYDVVPQAHLPNDGELALAVDGEYRHAALTRQHLINEARSWRIRDAERQVSDALEVIRTTAEEQQPLSEAFPGLRSDILGFAQRLLDGRPAGRPLSLEHRA